MPNPTKLLRNHRQPNRAALPPSAGMRRAARLLSPLEQLADDTWRVAQKSPALPADPALVEAARRLLGPLRRLGPDLRLRRRAFAPGIRLHGLAIALRQMQAALARHLVRHGLTQPRTTDDEIDDITRLEALILRGFADQVAERHAIKLPPALRRQTPPPPAHEPGRPPPPRPHIRRSQLIRANARRRTRKAASRVAVAATPPQTPPLPRIR